MKSTGIVRSVDKMGRVVIPKEIRNQLDVKNDQDSFEIYMEDDAIVLKKHQPNCIFCGAANDCIDYNGKYVCGGCIRRLFDIKSNLEEMEELNSKNML